MAVHPCGIPGGNSLEGLVVTIPKSKTDPERAGQTIGTPYAPIRKAVRSAAFEVWLEQSNIADGYPLYRPSAGGAGKSPPNRSAITSSPKSSSAWPCGRGSQPPHSPDIRCARA